MTQAIDWAVAENARAGSPYAGRLDTTAIAASGWSCGGVQALTLGTSDPRVKTIVIHNSGLFPEGAPRLPEMELAKDALARVRLPIVYILGGPTDIAFANGSDDFARLTGVAAAKVSFDVGHGGTFFQPNGGMAAEVATRWLDWTLKRDAAAAKWFVGLECRYCAVAGVGFASKNLR